MGNLRDRLRSLEKRMPSSTLGQVTRADMQELDDRTLLQYAIQETKRAIAEGAAYEPIEAGYQEELGVTNNQELLELLQSWLTEPFTTENTP